MVSVEELEWVVRDFEDRGILWLLQSNENLRALITIVAKQIAVQLDFSRAQQLNRSLVLNDLRKHEVDLIYKVPFFRGKREVWIYILVEHQSRVDRTMPLRLLSYMVQLWEAQRRAWEDNKVAAKDRKLYPIIPIVFYTGKRRWNTPISLRLLMDLPEALVGFVPQFETLQLKLNETSPKDITEPPSALGWLLRLNQGLTAGTEFPKVLAEALIGLEALPVESQAEWARAMHYIGLFIRHKFANEDQDALFDIVLDNITHTEGLEDTRMTGAQVLIAQGKREGKLEGKLEGNLEGRRQTLFEQLSFKFGTIPSMVASRVVELPESQISILSQQILTAKTLSELGL